MTRFLWVCAGGAIGTGARYLLGNWIIERVGTAFPYHTLAVNLLGSFLLGGLMHVGVSTDVMSPTVRFTLATGVLGGCTTDASFNYETLRYLQHGAWLAGVTNVAGTVFGCLVAGVLGFALAARLVGQ